MGWQSKNPQDMSLDELAQAKASLAARFQEVQQEYNTLSAAIAHVDYQATTRFGLQGTVSSPAGLPPFPIERMADIADVPLPEPTEPPQPS